MSCTGPATIVIAEGALEELRSILKNYSFPLCVTDEFIHAQYSQTLEEIVEAPCKWVMASTYPRNSSISRDFPTPAYP